jgi:hypothetical protein
LSSTSLNILLLYDGVAVKSTTAKMSALGQKQTRAVQKVMSALPPKADIASLIQSPRRRVQAALAAR